MTYQEYPKKMVHPAHAPAVMRQLPGKGQGIFAPDTICESPERFPDIIVASLEQEKKQAARGYRPVGMANSEEYDRVILESKPTQGYEFNEFPKWKYHAIEAPKLVNSKSEEMSLGKGWGDYPIIATEDDLIQWEKENQVEQEPVQSVVASHEVERQATKPISTQRKPEKKVDRRSKAFRDAQKATA